MVPGFPAAGRYQVPISGIGKSGRKPKGLASRGVKFSRLLVIADVDRKTIENNYMIIQSYTTHTNPCRNTINEKKKIELYCVCIRSQSNIPGKASMCTVPGCPKSTTPCVSFSLSCETRRNVSNTMSAAGEIGAEISRVMSRGFRKKLLRILLRDWATISLVSLLTSWMTTVSSQR